MAALAPVVSAVLAFSARHSEICAALRTGGTCGMQTSLMERPLLLLLALLEEASGKASAPTPPTAFTAACTSIRKAATL
jgi:hypothetical protein